MLRPGMKELTITTERHTQLLDITNVVRDATRGAEGAAVLVYVPHTTAGLTINEHADPLVARDFEMALEKLAPELVTPGPLRVDAPCQHYPACGGCRFQDLAYDAQVQTKHQWVADSLQRLAGLEDAPLEPIVPSKSQFHYRNKMEYSFTQLEDGPTLGLHKAGRWDEVLEIEKCWLTSEVGNAVRNRMREWAREEKLTAYDQETHEGYLRHLMLREGRNTGQMLVQLVTNRGERF